MESNFDTGVTFQTYFNYIITPDKERKDKPNFYDLIFGDHIEHEIPTKYASTSDMKPSKYKSSLKRNRTKIDTMSIKTRTLRGIKLRFRDDETSNNKWLKKYMQNDNHGKNMIWQDRSLNENIVRGCEMCLSHWIKHINMQYSTSWITLAIKIWGLN